MGEERFFTCDELDLFQFALACLCLDRRHFFLYPLLLLGLVAPPVGDGGHRAVLVFCDGFEEVACRVFVGLEAQVDGGRLLLLLLLLLLEERVEVYLERTADVHRCCGKKSIRIM